jgi:putative hydrolase of the HAD superfamily
LIPHDLLMGVRDVVFDAVGTLIYPEPPAAVVYARIGRLHGGTRSTAEIADRFRAAFQRQEEIDRAAGYRTSEERERLRWQHVVSEVLDDTTDADACFKTLFDYFSQPRAWRCRKDTAAELHSLAGRGFVLGMASNYDHRLRSVVAGLPELGSIKHLIISSEVGWRKPAPEFFAAICRELQLPPEQILHVGDERLNDYEAARAAGLRALLFSS